MDELIDIIKAGENYEVEFKQKLNSALVRDVCAFANTVGGKIFVGISDEGNLVGVKESKKPFAQEISDMMQSLTPLPEYKVNKRKYGDFTVLELNIQKSRNLLSHKNVVYIRNGANNYPLSVQEILEKSSENLLFAFDRIKSRVKLDKIDLNLLKSYLKRRERNRGTSYDLDNLEAYPQMLRFADGKYLTNAGILCMTKNPQNHLPNSAIRVIVFDDQSMNRYSDRREFIGNLIDMQKKVEEYLLKRFNRIGGVRVGFENIQYLEYPIDAVREGLINAITHRNYFNESDIRVFLFADRLEIVNPGAFPPGSTPEHPEHNPRNSILSQYFYDLGVVEKYGSGVKKIYDAVKAHPYVTVEYEITPYVTKLIFRKNYDEETLDDIDQKILDFLATGRKKSIEIASFVNLSKQSAITRLNKLKVYGFVSKTGSARSITYELNRKPES